MKIKTAAALTGAAAGAIALRSWLKSQRAFSFSGRNALITGGSRGLGFVLARMLLDEGCRVAVCARDREELQTARQKLAPHGELMTFQCDLREEDAVRRLAQQVQEELGPVDLLINNAGVIAAGPLEAMTDQDYNDNLQLYVRAPMLLTQELVEGMKQRGGGRIVNIASIGGRVSVPHFAPYSAGKFGLVGYSRALRAELQKHNIFVTTVCPGMMRTGSHTRAQFKSKHRQEQTWFSLLNSNPLLSVSAENAAEQILKAARDGDAELVIGIAAKAGALLAGLAPGLTQEVMALVDRVLPAYGGIGTAAKPGIESESMLSPSPLTALSDAPVEQLNQQPEGQKLNR